MHSVIYYLALSFLLMHEMDAVMHMEWHLLFVLRNLPDAIAYPAFILLHLPLFFAFFWFSQHRNLAIQARFRIAVAGLLFIHAALHFRLRHHEAYQFQDLLSNSLIFGSALLALAYLLLVWRAKPQQ